jgi:hypothetical protein
MWLQDKIESLNKKNKNLTIWYGGDLLELMVHSHLMLIQCYMENLGGIILGGTQC